MAAASIPLCVDLDGTLTHSDLLIESFLVLIKKNPSICSIASSGCCGERDI